MKKRMMCVWLPHWPLQETLARRPECKGQAVVLYTAGGRGGQTVVARSRPAAACGVRPGMPLAQARAVLDGVEPPATYELSDPFTHRLALHHLAEWCEQFSPFVGIEDMEQPECLLADISGCAHQFGGEHAMTTRVVAAFADRGFVVRVASADTLGTAWAVAHHGRQAVIPDGEHAEALQPLPVEALRIAADAADKLRRLGIRTVAQLQALPRDSLPSRFGPAILRRLDQALGKHPELFRTIRALLPVEIS